MGMIDKGGLQVAQTLADFIDGQALPGTGISPDAFWAGAAKIFEGFAPENRALLKTRDEIQAQIDAWHQARRGQAIDQGEYQAFLRSIDYLVDEPQPFSITSERVDDELARLAGPQLVVPVLNARFLLNAANARWGSLYDALYGTDALGPPPTGSGFDAERGAQVIARAKTFLDEAVPARPCRRGRRRGCPSGRWRRSAGSGHLAPARPAAARPDAPTRRPPVRR